MPAHITNGGSDSTPFRVAVQAHPGRGKTTTILQLVDQLGRRGHRIGGVVQVPLGPPGAREGYELLDPGTGERRPFAHRRALRRPHELEFSFDQAGWDWAAARIRAGRREAEVLVVDELGRLEARGTGHLPALLEDLVDERAEVWLLGVRETAARPLERALGDWDAVLQAPPTEGMLEVWVERVVQMLGGPAR